MNKEKLNQCIELLSRYNIISHIAGEIELKHDTLAKAIAERRNVEEIALVQVQQLLRSQIMLEEKYQELFTEKQLNFIEPYLEKLLKQKLINEKGERLISLSKEKLEADKRTLKAQQEKELNEAKERAEKEAKLREIAEVHRKKANLRSYLAGGSGIMAIVLLFVVLYIAYFTAQANYEQFIKDAESLMESKQHLLALENQQRAADAKFWGIFRLADEQTISELKTKIVKDSLQFDKYQSLMKKAQVLYDSLDYNPIQILELDKLYQEAYKTQPDLKERKEEIEKRNRLSDKMLFYYEEAKAKAEVFRKAEGKQEAYYYGLLAYQLARKLQKSDSIALKEKLNLLEINK